MSSTMVTARMDEHKKMRGNAILKRQGKTPSDVINELYDIIIKEGGVPWVQDTGGIASMSEEEIKQAYDFIRSIPAPKSRFSNMTDDEIKKERLSASAI